MPTSPTLTTLSLRVASRATERRSNSTSDPTQHQSPVAAWRKPRPSPSRFLTWIEPAAQGAAGSMLSGRHRIADEGRVGFHKFRFRNINPTDHYAKPARNGPRQSKPSNWCCEALQIEREVFI